MIQSIFWYSALIIGSILFVFGIGYLIHTKGVKEEDYARATVIEFIGAWIMYIPYELFKDISMPDSMPFFKVLESILMALLRAFTVYMGNGLEKLSYEGHPVFTGIYTTLMTAIGVVLLLFMLGIIIKLFNNIFPKSKLSLCKNRPLYIFSDSDEKNLSIAQSITEERKNIVFANCKDNMEPEIKQQIMANDGIYISVGITDVIKKVGKNAKKIEIFLFGSSEEKNLKELEEICNLMKSEKKLKARVYIELSDTPWELYQEFLKNYDYGDRLIVNLVRTEQNFAYNNLIENSIFENAVSGEANIKQIKVLLVGMNNRNLEMLKALLHLGQMPGYRLNVAVIDDKKQGWNAIKCRMPEICAGETLEDYKIGNELYSKYVKNADNEGDEIYKLEYIEKIDYVSSVFDEIVKNDYSDFTFAFVNAGSDLLNIDIAMRLNSICNRKNRVSGYKIQVNIMQQGITKLWNTKMIENIDIVGSVEQTYSYNFITMSKLEKASKEYHEGKSKIEGNCGKSWLQNCNNDYNRRQVYARTLNLRYKALIINELYGDDDHYDIADEDEYWQMYEHMRWSVYTRTLGYVLPDESLLNREGGLNGALRTRARAHGNLVPYDELKIEDKRKDKVYVSLIAGIFKTLDSQD